MKNLFKALEKKLEKCLIGYNTGELTASQISEITSQCRFSFENRVAYQIRELETLIVATGKEHKTNIIFTIPEKEDPKVFDKALNHFKENGFRALSKTLRRKLEKISTTLSFPGRLMKRKHERILKEVFRVSKISEELLTLYATVEIYFMICFFLQYDFGRLDNEFKNGPVVIINLKGLSNYPYRGLLKRYRFFNFNVTRLRRENQYNFISGDTMISYRYWINERRLHIYSRGMSYDIYYDIKIRL